MNLGSRKMSLSLNRDFPSMELDTEADTKIT